MRCCCVKVLPWVFGVFGSNFFFSFFERIIINDFSTCHFCRSTDDAYAAPLALTFAEEFEARGGSIKARVQFPKSADLAGLTSEAEEAVEAIRESGSVVNVISAVAHDTELAFQYIMDKGMDTPLWTWCVEDCWGLV